MTPKQKQEHAEKLAALKTKEQALLAVAERAKADVVRAMEANKAARQALSSIRHEIADHEVMPLVDSLSPYLREQLLRTAKARADEAQAELARLGLVSEGDEPGWCNFTATGVRVLHILLKQEP